MRSNVRKMASPKIDRKKPNMTSLIIEARVTSYEGFIYLSKETICSVNWSATRVINLVIQPWCSVKNNLVYNFVNIIMSLRIDEIPVH